MSTLKENERATLWRVADIQRKEGMACPEDLPSDVGTIEAVESLEDIGHLDFGKGEDAAGYTVSKTGRKVLAELGYRWPEDPFMDLDRVFQQDWEIYTQKLWLGHTLGSCETERDRRKPPKGDGWEPFAAGYCAEGEFIFWRRRRFTSDGFTEGAEVTIGDGKQPNVTEVSDGTVRSRPDSRFSDLEQRVAVLEAANQQAHETITGLISWLVRRLERE